MSLSTTLSKLTKEDKLEILRHLIILPTIEEDHTMSSAERHGIYLAGKKLGFTPQEIDEEIDIQLNEFGAVEGT